MNKVNHNKFSFADEEVKKQWYGVPEAQKRTETKSTYTSTGSVRTAANPIERERQMIEAAIRQDEMKINALRKFLYQ
jgi:hypothetical protein